MMSICTKMKINRVCYQPLTTPQVVLIFIIALHLCGLNNNMKPNSTEDGWTLQRPSQNQRITTNIFGVFDFFKANTQCKNKQRKIFLDFSFKANQRKETNQEKQRKYFWYFWVFRKKQQKSKRKRNMIWRWVWCRCTSPKLRLLS